MEKIIHKLINEFTEGVDTYTHNDSTWLIFSETKQWVIELTENKTLWYNYNFFKSVFAYASLDCVQNQHLITKWVEDNIINKVSDIRFRDARDNKHQFEDTLENGVKETRLEVNITEGEVDDIIQDGVRHTKTAYMKTDWSVEDTIENGVKETQFNDNENKSWVEGVIKKGVKETKSDDFNVSQFLCEEVIDKGVKETNHVDVMKFFNNKMEDTLKNGVKETKQKKNALLILDTSGRELILESHLVVRDGVKETSHRQFLKTYDVKDTIQDGTEHNRWILDGCNDPVDEVLDNGVKETNYDTDNYTDDVKEVIREGVKKTLSGLHIPGAEMDVNHIIENGVKITTPLESREYTGDIDEVLGNGVRTSHPRQYVGEDIIDKVIDKGVIETHREICEYKHTVEHIIQTGVKETHDDVYHHKGRIEGVIKNGVKETKEMLDWVCTDRMLSNILENGIKETKTPGKDGDIVSMVEWMEENNSTSYPKMIDDVIQDGVKETKVCHYTDPKTNLIHVRWPDEIDDIVENGEKINGTYAGGQRQSEKCKSVVEYGKQI